jgi:predicted KAP-like P-loop ATPase
LTDKLKNDLEELAASLDRAAQSAALSVKVSGMASALTPDEPIRSSSEDRLNRSGFATAVAQAILSLSRLDSMVVAVHGKWGTGKTSLLNLIEEKLQSASARPPVIFRFNPWGFSDQEQLATQFFRGLSEFLKLHKTIGPLAGIADAVEEYGAVLSPLARVIFPRATESVTAGWRFLRRFKPAARNAAELKAQINTALARSELRLIIIMDDIDRLNAPEIRQVFQLIKVNANFSNTVYLVAFDVKPVRKALASVAPGRAMEYLEKIVQVAFELPPIPKPVIAEMVLSKLNDVLGSRMIDTQRFGNMFHSGFSENFQTIRDINRYFNVFKFAFNLIGEDTNFIDLAAIQALSLFHPDVFHSIERNPDMFAGTWVWTSTDRPERERLRPDYEKIFDQVQRSERQSVVSLCRFLFPKVEYVYGHSNTLWGQDWVREWERERRVGTEKYFRYYFELAVPETGVRQAEFDKALGSAHSLETFLRALRNFAESGRFGTFIDMLRNSVDGLDRTQMLTIMESIFVFGDQVSIENASVFLGSVSEHVRFGIWLFFDLLDRLGEGRFAHVLEFMTHHPAIFTITNVAAMCDQIVSDTTNPNRRAQRDKYPDLTVDVVNRMKAAAVETISGAAHDGRLASVRPLPFVLARWREWGDPKLVVSWITETFLSTPKSALQFASGFAQPVTSFGLSDRVPRVTIVVDVKAMSEFVDLKAVSALVANLSEEESTPEERLVKARFFKAKAQFEAGVNPMSPGVLAGEME